MVKSFGKEMLKLKEVNVKPVKNREDDGVDVLHISWRVDKTQVSVYFMANVT